MPIRKISITDNITYGQGITVKDGIVGERRITIGDNLAGYILLESGDVLLQEDDGKFVTDVLVIND